MPKNINTFAATISFTIGALMFLVWVFDNNFLIIVGTAVAAVIGFIVDTTRLKND